MDSGKTELDKMYESGFNNGIQAALIHVRGALDRLEPSKHQKTRELLTTVESRIKMLEKK